MPAKNEYIRIFRAFSDESRIRVLELLRDGEKCACILLEDLNISQPTLSHHMKILCDSGIVKSRPVGKWSYYMINDSGCAYARELITKLTERSPEDTYFFSRKLHRMLLLLSCVIKRKLQGKFLAQSRININAK
jgi:ArsR family transcriptional regulator, arsenate/arsenite/antimonite-responsive transcriptional repressor